MVTGDVGHPETAQPVVRMEPSQEPGFVMTLNQGVMEHTAMEVLLMCRLSDSKENVIKVGTVAIL